MEELRAPSSAPRTWTTPRPDARCRRECRCRWRYGTSWLHPSGRNNDRHRGSGDRGERRDRRQVPLRRSGRGRRCACPGLRSATWPVVRPRRSAVGCRRSGGRISRPTTRTVPQSRQPALPGVESRDGERVPYPRIEPHPRRHVPVCRETLSGFARSRSPSLSLSLSLSLSFLCAGRWAATGSAHRSGGSLAGWSGIEAENETRCPATGKWPLTWWFRWWSGPASIR